jgi:tRNA A37 threonylcarbamoyladenosine biosynthesis protein TsaE
MIGTEDAFTRGISLIEWPEIAENDLPEDRLAISLSYDKNDDDTRHITIRGNSRWKVLFEDIDKEWK